MGEGRYTISELVERTGVPAATIHHYRAAGLLPVPEQEAPNRFFYGERHVQAVKLVRLLRERRRLPLEVIREVLPDLLAGGEQEAFHPEAWSDALAQRDPRTESRAVVVRSAADLFGSRGYTDVSIAEIAEAAGVAKGTVYRHVSSKEELFFAAVEAAANDALAQFGRAVDELGSPVDSATAAKVLAVEIRPALPLLLELAARAVQGHAGHPAAARRVLDAALTGVGNHVKGRGTARERGAQTLQAVIVDAFRAAVRPAVDLPG